MTTTADRDTIRTEILSVWKQHGGRFLGGNHGHLSDSELMVLHPGMYPDPAPFWKAWS